jgi:hypothetical protein
MVFCSRPCRGKAKRRREAQRAHAEVREWYEQVAAGLITDGLISAAWAREWLRFQDGEVDDPLVGLLSTPTAGS